MNEIKTSRIRKNAINYLRTIIWYENISINVSIKRRIAVEINKAFRLGPDPTETENLLFIANANRVSEFFDQQESAIWYKYGLGTTAPNKSTLEICEVKIPESSLYFQHPIWKLLERFPTHEDLKIFYATLPKKNLDYLLKKLPMDLTQSNAGDIWRQWKGKPQFFMLVNFLDFVGYIVYSYYKCIYELKFEQANNVHKFLTQNIQFILDNLRWCSVYLLDLLFLHIRQPNQSTITNWIELISHSEIKESIIKVRKMKRFVRMQQSMDEFKKRFIELHYLE